LLDTGTAWLLFLHADLRVAVGSDPFVVGARFRGTVEQDVSVFPSEFRITGRRGNRVEGQQKCRFRHGTGRWSFSGIVLANRIAYVTDRLSGYVTYPGLYQGEFAGDVAMGSWQVPSYYQGGTFSFAGVAPR
jgi:hypothetical protein